MLYAICNGIFTVYMIGVYDLDLSVKVLYGMYYTSTIGPFINSAFNPVILLVRGKTLREYAKAKIRALFCLNNSADSSAGQVTRFTDRRRATYISDYRKAESGYKMIERSHTPEVVDECDGIRMTEPGKSSGS